MGIFDNLLARFGYTKALMPRPPGAMLDIAGGYEWGVPEASEAVKQARLYAALTWIATAVDTVAAVGGAVPYQVFKQVGEAGGGDDEEIPNHEFELLLRRPNPSQSRLEFLRDAISWYKVTGNLYLYLNRPSALVTPSEMWIVPSSMIAPVPDGRSYIAGYKFTPPGQADIPIETWRILHLKTWNPLNPFVGLSAVQSLALDSYGDIAQQKWNLGLFDKNAGKFPGVLAFKHMVAEPEWKKILDTRDREWGGTQRAQIMMLRGVGDAVQWLPTALSQKEMEFLGGRTFTKEEIYGKLAPGLASILAVNATEANAIAGKGTLIEFGVWPVLEQIGQKFEAELLPLYGENLTGHFEDIRQTNRILDLEEQAEYAKYHTINEVRMEYYGDEPLELDPSVIEEMEAEEAESAERQAQLPIQMQAQAGQPAKADKPKSKLDPRGFLFPAQIGPTTPAPGEKKQPPPQIAPPASQPEGDTVPDEQTPDDGQTGTPEAELKSWQEYVLKRWGRPHMHAFTPRVLPLFRAARIRAGLKAAVTPDDVRALFAQEREPSASEVLAALRDATDAARGLNGA